MSEARQNRLIALLAIIVGLSITLATMTGVITYAPSEPDGLSLPAALLVAGGIVGLHFNRPTRYRRRGNHRKDAR